MRVTLGCLLALLTAATASAQSPYAGGSVVFDIVRLSGSREFDTSGDGESLGGAVRVGTSLGVQPTTGVPTASGHNHHLRAINSIRAAGGIQEAVARGVLTRGVMHACVVHGVDYVLAGSIRDDGPLPDVITDVVRAQDAMRLRIPAVGLAIMVATTLHSVATGNLLPSSVQIICVDNNMETITKLMDRGTRQAFGLVTDCQFFLKELAARLEVGS